VKTTLSKITIAVLIVILSGCRVRSTRERLMVENENKTTPQTTETVDALNNSNNDRGQPNNNGNNNNNKNNSTSVSYNNSPVNNSTKPTDNRNNNPQQDPKISIPEFIIKIFIRKVPETSSTVSLLSFGILSSIYFYKNKVSRRKL
jgi:hypothetical protein